MLVLGRGLLFFGLLAGCTASGSAPPDTAGAISDRLPHLPSGVRLIGLGKSDLEGLLGRPSLVRSEQQAQYWRYSLGPCQLDLFLYAEPTGAPARVVYLDARPSSYASVMEAGMCGELAAFLRGERRPPHPSGPQEGRPLPIADRS
jgi:hypothetical protein